MVDRASGAVHCGQFGSPGCTLKRIRSSLLHRLIGSDRIWFGIYRDDRLVRDGNVDRKNALEPEGYMNFKQFYLGCLAHASYYIGSEGEAAVIDPQRDIQQY